MAVTLRDPAPGPVWPGRPMTLADILTVVEFEQAACAHPAHAWTAENYRSSIKAAYATRVLTEPGGDRPVAVCILMDGVGEAHLLNIAVDRAWSGRGLASDLLLWLALRSQEAGHQDVWLEVRQSNDRAKALYQRQGYVEVGLRKRYYPCPVHQREDAVVMKLSLPAHAPLV